MTWVLVGAGAQGRITLEAVRATGSKEPVLFVDDAAERHGSFVLGVEVISRQTLVERVPPVSAEVLVTLGHNRQRVRVADELAAEGYSFGTLVHPRAFVQPSASLGPGTVVFPGAIVQSGAELGPHVLVNTGAIVEHDCRLGEGASVGPGVCMGGRCAIERMAFVGTGAVLCPRIAIGELAIIGAGALVAEDVPAGMLAYGVPARAIRPVDPERDWPRIL